MLRSLIVDDERLPRQWLRDILEGCPAVRVVGEADSVANASAEMERLQPDVTFLDIELGDGTAFDVLERAVVTGHVVFLTAYSQHAVRAFEVEAVDYLLKPAEPEYVERALRRVRARPLPALATEEGRLRPHDRVLLSIARRAQPVLVSEIIFVAGAADYSELHLTGRRVALLRRSLRHWERQLPSNFVRIHRSTIANLARIDQIREEGGALYLKLEEAERPLLVSRRRARAVRAHVRFAAPQRAEGAAGP